MGKNDIRIDDLARILFGNAPPIFLLEVLLRITLVFIAAIVMLRLLGSRMSGQLTTTEMSVMVMMGAIIAPPAQMPERGLLLGTVAMLTVLGCQRGISWLNLKNPKTEAIAKGKTSLMVKDGVLQIPELDKTSVSNQQMLSILRSQNILNLGMVRRAYLETNGEMSIYKWEEGEHPGLPIYPQTDHDILSTATKPSERLIACCRCGTVAKNNSTNCPTCGSTDWTEAIL